MNRFVYASCLFLLTGCQQPGALDNADFNLWCGASLCNWKTEQGRIRRVPTWDAEDYGVELVGKPVVISQLAKLNEVNGSCLKFSIVGNVETPGGGGSLEIKGSTSCAYPCTSRHVAERDRSGAGSRADPQP